MVACARAVTAAGLRPVFADCDERLTMDVFGIDDFICDLTCAIMPVHVYGRRCNMDLVHAIAEQHGVAVIEDMAEIHGIPRDCRTDAACWSFYQNKIVAGEEGGAVEFKTQAAADRARELRSYGFTPAHDFRHHPFGWNYRLSNANAALIRKSLASVGLHSKARRRVESWYDEIMPDAWKMPRRDAVWIYDIRLRNTNTHAVVKNMNERGYAARMAFKPMSEQPEYLGHYRHLQAYAASRQVIYLPVSPTMTQSDVKEITECLFSIVENQSVHMDQ